MRLFVGIPLPGRIRRSIYSAVSRYSSNLSGVKFVEEQNLHITVKFMGEIPESRVNNIVSALERVHFTPIRIHVVGAGAFPHPSNPRVVWAGIREGFDEIVDLSREVDDILSGEGVPREVKPFHPHVTVARVKRPDPRVSEMIRQLSSLDFGEFVADSYVLYQSTLTPSGPIYRKLHVFGGD